MEGPMEAPSVIWCWLIRDAAEGQEEETEDGHPRQTSRFGWATSRPLEVANLCCVCRRIRQAFLNGVFWINFLQVGFETTVVFVCIAALPVIVGVRKVLLMIQLFLQGFSSAVMLGEVWALVRFHRGRGSSTLSRALNQSRLDSMVMMTSLTSLATSFEVLLWLIQWSEVAVPEQIQSSQRLPALCKHLMPTKNFEAGCVILTHSLDV
uniref:Uncharacterized protein n=1 Tax=Alexandrium monilatum TaxID=311494 RepID=A0A7S4RBK9_9DINO|mmetsp:Transcript_4539/g.13470  ORF Transcript_4539/g.13470 Transcript_4539/m.13470 type:complete len:208 (-) Transcript_4539:119-742(-)